MSRFQLHQGDCLKVLARFEDESIDAFVTDPPYGLGFMGKAWDAAVPSAAVWEQCLRVLKPGGQLLAFAGTRTQHRMAGAIEDAGFEIRDMLAWCYSTGFPRSTDMGEAVKRFQNRDPLESPARVIDPLVYQCTAFLKSARQKAGWTNRQMDELFGTNGMAGHWTTSGSQPHIPSWNQWTRLKESLGFDDSFDDFVKAAGVTERPDDWGTKGGDSREFLSTVREVGETQHWGTGLKPALEPITLARKPFPGTNRQNVQAHGTGALHIAACRIGDRWPANLLSDGSESVDQALNGNSRLFFHAKATRTDRDEGCEKLATKKAGVMNGAEDGSMPAVHRKNNHPTVKPTEVMRWLCRLITPVGGTICDPFMGSGSTGKAAMLDGFQFVGIELDPNFIKIARSRISHAERQAGQPESLP